MSHKHFIRVAVVIAIIVLVAVAVPALAKGPGGGGGGGGHTEVATNNLSFPAIAADGASVADPVEEFTVPYTGPYTGLTAEEIAALALTGPWYAQKTDGNAWNAEFVPAASTAGQAVVVYGVDWGDNIESVNPAVGRPYRLETALFAQAAPWAEAGFTTMTAYTMAMLANPSSPDEVQGTNTKTYESDYATITSPKPGLKIQNITDITGTLTWNATTNLWESGTAIIPETKISFAPELNVAGKYIFGASQGGWKPKAVGTYRITFYIPTGLSGSQIMMATTTTLGNLVEGAWVPSVPGVSVEEEGEGGVATPILDVPNNLTYVDVQVIAKGGGGRPQ